MKYLSFISFLIVSCFLQTSFSQNAIKSNNLNNALYLEIEGNGYLYSLNYERNIVTYNNLKASIRLGVTPFVSRNGGYGTNALEVINMLNFILGKQRTKGELGLGITNHFNFNPEISYSDYRIGWRNVKSKNFPLDPKSSYNIDFTSQLSLRHNFKKNDLFYRVSFIYMIIFTRDDKGLVEKEHFPWFGLSFGKLF